MSDEDLGRIWCRLNGLRPEAVGRWDVNASVYCWQSAEDTFFYARPDHALLPAVVYHAIPPGVNHSRGKYDTESLAYAAVGAALRAVCSLADDVRRATA